MDRLDRMQLFVRVVDRRSFAAAAADLRLARSTVTESIKQLEKDLGVRLLDRTTRHVTTTLDGLAFYERCQTVLAEVEEAENIFRDAQPRGLLRVDAHPLLTQTFLLPHLADFLGRYPLLKLQLGQGDRLVDMVREGIDCVIRAGEIEDSGLIMRRLGMIREVTCASPAYIEKYGLPVSPDALEGHMMIGFISSRSGQIIPLEFTVNGKLKEVTLPAQVMVNNSDTMADLGRRGFGIFQAPRYRLEKDISAGTLVELLPDYPPSPTPLSALYPHSRHTAPRLRAFLDWISELFKNAAL